MEIWRHTLAELTGGIEPVGEYATAYVPLGIFDVESIKPLPQQGYGTALADGNLKGIRSSDF